VSPVWRSVRFGWAFVFGVAVTTAVAGTAVAPFAVYHFHRMSHFGLVANMIAAPLVSLLIMPMALLALIAMPFGLEAWPLYAMGFGIELMVGAARVIVDRRLLKSRGAHALYIEGLSIRTETVAGTRGARPWTRHSNGTPDE
jgi:predicted membrane metal-binding protein